MTVSNPISPPRFLAQYTPVHTWPHAHRSVPSYCSRHCTQRTVSRRASCSECLPGLLHNADVRLEGRLHGWRSDLLHPECRCYQNYRPGPGTSAPLAVIINVGYTASELVQQQANLLFVQYLPGSNELPSRRSTRADDGWRNHPRARLDLQLIEQAAVDGLTGCKSRQLPAWVEGVRKAYLTV